ncbi:XkdX family protein [Pseudoflavonifractor sp. 524-17]|nr:XkdX family protein [Pseudoflavonifractor sp. 524-17]NCE63745.1 XkdX family protein [Pseudoflavonifractor sp. 524-17]
MATAYDLAKKYYPKLWDKSRLEALVAAGRLTEEEVEEIINAKEA